MGVTVHDGPGAELDMKFFIDLGKKVDDIHSMHTRQQAADGDFVWQMPIFATLAPGANPVIGGDKMEPPRECCWGVRWMSFSGFTAGTLQLQLNNIEVVQPSITAGYQGFGRGELILQPGDKLALVIATALTGTAMIFGRADAFPYEYLATYLAGRGDRR